MASISISGLTVDFAVFGHRARSLKNTLFSQATGGRLSAGAREIVNVRAIDHLDLKVRDGDRIGLSGHNGSGKTTLLRVLAGIYKPVAGQARIEGSVGAMLDADSGMEAEATGLDNIYLRGSLLGLSRRRISALIDNIAEFSELGDFLQLPIKTYSAGMIARLSFAISTATQHDILLIDEGIGTGDAAFQEKAQKRIESLFSRTSIIMMASHSEELLQRYCNRRVTLSQGKLVSDEPIVTPREAAGDRETG